MPGHTQTSSFERATYHHGDLRHALINASVQLVLETGSEAFTLKDASRIAGVSVAAPYRHFSDKAELLFEVAEESFRMMGRAMEKALAGKELGTVEAITIQGQTYVQFAGRYPNLFRLMFGQHESRPEMDLSELLCRTTPEHGNRSILDLMSMDEAGNHKFDMPEELISEGVSCFSSLLKNVAIFLRKHDIPVSETLRVSTHLWATVHGTASLLIDRNFQNLIPTFSTDEIVASATQYYFSGLLHDYSNQDTLIA